MADTVKMQDTVAYDDEKIAAKEAEEKKAAILADAAKPFDPDALLEVRHLSKRFPVKKNLLGKVQQELVAVDDVSFTLKAGETLGPMASKSFLCVLKRAAKNGIVKQCRINCR